MLDGTRRLWRAVRVLAMPSTRQRGPGPSGVYADGVDVDEDAATCLGRLARSAELSSYRENLLEQILSVELIQACWLRDMPPLELAPDLVDFSGYDLVASCGAVTRHIQLNATAGKVVLHRALRSERFAVFEEALLGVLVDDLQRATR